MLKSSVAALVCFIVRRVMAQRGDLSFVTTLAWNTQVDTLCSDAAAAASPGVGENNPSGLMACYNIAAVENTTGLFSGDLRLYSMGKSTLGAGSSVQVTIDFGKSVGIQSSTELQMRTSAIQNIRRSLLLHDDENLARFRSELPNTIVRRIPQTGSNNDLRNPIHPGSTAPVAKPSTGIKAIVPTAVLGNSDTPAAILPGEGRLTQSTVQAMSSPPGQIKSQAIRLPPAPTSVSSSSSSANNVPRPQVDKIQFLGKVDLDQANANPTGAGLLGSLQPRVFLTVTAPGSDGGSSQTIIDMTSSTRSFLVGVSGAGIRKRSTAYVIPGRILGGADRSETLVGLYLVAALTLIQVLAMAGGILTRWNMRRTYRDRANSAGRALGR